MNYKSIAILIFCASVTATVLAQDDEIGGKGTPNFIPKFLSSHKIGNSNIFQSSHGNIAIGTTNPGAAFTDPTLEVDSTSELVVDNQGPTGVFGTAASSLTGSAGVRGYALASSGNTDGVIGVSLSDAGVGVHGNHVNPSGNGGGGVQGICESTSGFCFGVSGAAIGATGFAAGVLGSAQSPFGTGGAFQNLAFGNILLGQSGPNRQSVFRVDGAGRVFADGGFQPNGADFAESMEVTGDRSKYVAGDLLVIDTTATRHLALAKKPYSTLVAGIYSTKPGMLGSTRKVDESAPSNEIPLAVVGIVPCKVTAENGPIQIGDLLVTSFAPGHAMKGTDRNRMLGAVVGKALEPLSQGTGVIQVLVTLQ